MDDKEKAMECIKIISNMVRAMDLPLYYDDPLTTKNPREAKGHPFFKLLNKKEQTMTEDISEADITVTYKSDSDHLSAVLRDLLKPEDRIDSLTEERFNNPPQANYPNRKITIIFYSERE